MKSEHEQAVEKGKNKFEISFIKYVARAITIQWNIKPDIDTGKYKFKVYIDGKMINMEVDENDLADFGAGGPEEFRVTLLNQTVKEFLEKLSED